MGGKFSVNLIWVAWVFLLEMRLYGCCYVCACLACFECVSLIGFDFIDLVGCFVGWFWVCAGPLIVLFLVSGVC